MIHFDFKICHGLGAVVAVFVICTSQELNSSGQERGAKINSNSWKNRAAVAAELNC